MRTAYDVLGVPRNASNETIRTAFRKAAKACHPDLNVGNPTAELQIRVVITAYEMLKNPRKRAAYDRHFRERCREKAITPLSIGSTGCAGTARFSGKPVLCASRMRSAIRANAARHFGMATIANLLCACIVALTVSASVSQSSTHDASTQSTPDSVSTEMKLDGSHQVATTETVGRQELHEGGKSDWNAPLEGVPRYRTAVGSLAPTAVFPEGYVALVSERGFEVSGEPVASAGHAHEAEVARSGLIEVSNAATSLSSNSVKKPSLQRRATKFVSSHIGGRSSHSTSDLGFLASAAHSTTVANGNSKLAFEMAPSDNRLRIVSESGSIVEPHRRGDGRNQNRAIKVAAHQHSDDGRITSGEGPRDEKVKPNRRTTGPRGQSILPRGPSELLALLISPILTPKTSNPPHAKVAIGEGGRANSHKTRQFVVSNRAEVASEKLHRLHQIQNNSDAKT
jgi:hypothetical protein